MKFFPIFLPFFPPAGDFYGFSAVALARFALIRRWRATFPLEGKGFFRRCVALCNTFQQWRSRLLAPRLGRGSLCGDGWWVRLIFDICAASLRMTRWETGARDGRLTLGVGGMRDVSALARFALIRRFAPPSPPGGRLLSVVRGFM